MCFSGVCVLEDDVPISVGHVRVLGSTGEHPCV